MTLVVEDLLAIDIAKLRRDGIREAGASGHISWRCALGDSARVGFRLEAHGLRLRYTIRRHDGIGSEAIDELIRIVTTATRFGGCRHWFACRSCDRRCRKIYGGSRFRCRKCHGLGYRSQYECEAIRISYRRWKLRDLLVERGGQVTSKSLESAFPPKPPRMHWRTYDRLAALDEKLDFNCQIAVSEWLEKLDPRRPGRR